ncbi:MAG: alpha-ribazole phosphatase [Proteobacteria bacterium]|nr:alpha-ribazole phosphatase [Pseudomonadota bacterium]
MGSDLTRLYLLRHGETENHRGIFKYNGHNDVDVTEEGERQLAAQAERLKDLHFKAVYSSDLLRARKGAQAVAAKHGLEVRPDERLKEIHAGRWEGLSYEEVIQCYPGEAEKRFNDIVNYRIPGGGENLLDVQKRAIEAIDEIARRHRGEEIAIVAHGGTNRIILSSALSLPLENLLKMEQDFGCLNIIDYYNGAAVVKRMNMAPWFA